MLRSYLKLALRNFLNDKTFLLINLTGLAIGLASVITILSYVRYEFSYDNHWSGAERMYRIVQQTKKNGNVSKSVQLPAGLSTALHQAFPEIEAVTYANKASFDFVHKGESIQVDAISASTGFFSVFDLPFLYGNPGYALRERGHIVITERMAKAYFTHSNAVGEKLPIENYDGTKETMTITGVIKDIPDNTHFNGDVIISSFHKPASLDWSTAHATLPQYILLKKGAAIQQLQAKLAAFYKTYGFPKEVKLSFQPVPSIHLHSHIADEQYVNGDLRTLVIFSLIAVLILGLGCVNYINLTTARSLRRVREVGVRRVLGAAQKQVSLQFIGESFLFFCLALPIAFLIAHFGWPFFTRLLSVEVPATFLFHWQNLLLVALVSLVSGILSGIYPAFLLSKLHPVAVLKGEQPRFTFNVNIRAVLVVFQFVISVTLIIATTVIYRQVQFISNKPLGFNKDNLLVLPYMRYENKWETFKTELKQSSLIQSVTLATWNAGERYGASSSMENPKDSTQVLNFAFLDADPDLLQTMEVKLVAGRAFSTADALKTDQIDSAMVSGKHTNDAFLNLVAAKPIIISDKAAGELGLKEPVGKVLKLGALQGTVIGMVKDFQGYTLREENVPLVIRAHSNQAVGYAYIRVSSEATRSTIQYLQKTWKDFFPGSRFDFTFVDDRLQRLYDAERRLASLFFVFAALAIGIACSGLFSLVALSIQQRTKEIGIRKIVGAGSVELLGLISKDFLKLVGVAIVIAMPIAWWAMSAWLQNFAYRVGLNGWVFVFAGLLTSCIAFAAIGIQAFKAASANPVKVLRTE